MDIAYFIGGPFDLTKRAMESLPREWYCYAPDSFAFQPTVTSKAELAVSKHYYARLSDFFPRVHGAHDQPTVYVYQGPVR